MADHLSRIELPKEEELQKPPIDDKFPDEQIARPTTDELLEELPRVIQDYTLRIGRYDSEYEIWYQRFAERASQKFIMNTYDKDLPEALAQMYLWLHKEGLLEANR